VQCLHWRSNAGKDLRKRWHVFAGRILHDQQQSSDCEPEGGSNHLLRLVNLAVHLLEDEEEQVSRYCARQVMGA